MSSAPNSPEVIYISSDTDEEVPPKKKKYRAKVKRSSRSRGYGAHRKRIEKHHRHFARVRVKRKEELYKRQAAADPDTPYVSPVLCTSRVNNDSDIVREHRQWYFKSRSEGPRYLELRKKCVANPTPEICDTGNQSVFAAQFIHKGFVICPYVGTILHKPQWHTGYSLSISSDIIVDAQEHLHDIGYLYGQLDALFPCPPNYGRYINSLDPRVTWQKARLRSRLQGLNCVPQICENGSETVWIVASRDIQSGEELLLDYGKNYNWAAWGPKVVRGKVVFDSV